MVLNRNDNTTRSKTCNVVEWGFGHHIWTGSIDSGSFHSVRKDKAIKKKNRTVVGADYYN